MTDLAGRVGMASSDHSRLLKPSELEKIASILEVSEPDAVIKLGERIDGSLRDLLRAGTDRDPDDAPDLDGKAADNP